MNEKKVLFSWDPPYGGVLLTIYDDAPWGIELLLDGKGAFSSSLFLDLGGAEGLRKLAEALTASIPAVEAAEKAFHEKQQAQSVEARKKMLREELVKLEGDACTGG